MDLKEATVVLDRWIQEAVGRTHEGRLWPVGSLHGSFDDIEINWYVNEQDLPNGRARARWPWVEGRLKPHVAEALIVWTLYHGGPGMLKEG